MQAISQSGFPKPWTQGMQAHGYSQVVQQVLRSRGQVLCGPSQPTGPGYEQAVSKYSHAESDKELKLVLSKLFAALEANPCVPETCNLIGACYRHLERPTLALPFLWQALSLRPDFDLALTNLGLCCQELRLNKAARFYFEHQAVKQSPNTWVREQYAAFKQGDSPSK
jgi:tetratricopeptide (TPR) repeat protein